jgi:hypothetical protein
VSLAFALIGTVDAFAVLVHVMLKATDTGDGSTNGVAGNRRKEERSAVEFPMQVSGFDCGRSFRTEHTTACNIGNSSYNFHLHMKVENGMVRGLRALSCACGYEGDPTPALFYVARVEAIPGGYSVGVLKLIPTAPWKALQPEARERQELLS